MKGCGRCGEARRFSHSLTSKAGSQAFCGMSLQLACIGHKLMPLKWLTLRHGYMQLTSAMFKEPWEASGTRGM